MKKGIELGIQKKYKLQHATWGELQVLVTSSHVGGDGLVNHYVIDLVTGDARKIGQEFIVSAEEIHSNE